jgi:hypothetical protein
MAKLFWQKSSSQGAEFIASDVYTKHLLRNLRSELKRSRMKGKQDGGGNH